MHARLWVGRPRPLTAAVAHNRNVLRTTVRIMNINKCATELINDTPHFQLARQETSKQKLRRKKTKEDRKRRERVKDRKRQENTVEREEYRQ